MYSFLLIGLNELMLAKS